jgi:hypothetical protein
VIPVRFGRRREQARAGFPAWMAAQMPGKQRGEADFSSAALILSAAAAFVDQPPSSRGR